MALHRVALTSLLLLAALAAPSLTAQTTSAQTPTPATTAPPRPDPSLTPGASASPASTDGDEQGLAGLLCERATKDSVVDFMGGTPIRVAELTARGTMLYGCEVFFSNSQSIIVSVSDASDWEDTVEPLDSALAPSQRYQPVEGVEAMHYSDILGLVWRPSGADVYVGLRLPLLELAHHRQVLYLLFTNED